MIELPETKLKAEAESLKKQVEKMTAEKAKIEEWVKKKEVERDRFVKEAETLSAQLNKRKAELDAQEKELNQREKDAKALQAVNRDESARILTEKSEIAATMKDINSKLAALETRAKDLQKIEHIVNQKLEKWSEIKRAVGGL